MGATAVLFGVNLYGTIRGQNGNSDDFLLYAKFIDPIKLSGTITTPHFIYPMLVAVASMILPSLSYTILGAGIVLFFQLLLADVLWKCWNEVIPKSTWKLLAVALTLAVLTVAPVNLFTMSKHDMYFGYIGITVYHNPTIAICRPIALMHFVMFAKGLTGQKVTTRQIMYCFVTIVLATLMKPNYATVIVPVAALYCVVPIYRKDYREFRFIATGTLLPGILVLGWQFLFTYTSGSGDMGQSHIIFAPLVVYANRSVHLFPKFILSTVFPLSVLMLYGKQVIKDRYCLMGILMFIAGAAQAYLLAESGSRMYDGNFLWSAQLGLFLWFFVSMRFVIMRFIKEPTTRHWSPGSIIVGVAFALHLTSGIMWYVHETLSPGVYW